MTLNRDEAHSFLVEHYGQAAVDAEPTWASVMIDGIVSNGHDDRGAVLAELEHVDSYMPTPIGTIPQAAHETGSSQQG